MPNLAYANRTDAFDKVGTLSSRRVQSNDYYYKYLDHYTPGSIRFEKGTKSSAADRRSLLEDFPFSLRLAADSTDETISLAMSLPDSPATEGKQMETKILLIFPKIKCLR